MPSFDRIRNIRDTAQDKIFDSHTRFEGDDTRKTPLENAIDRFAHAKMDMETRIWGGNSGGARAELDEALNKYIDEQTLEIMSSLPVGATPDQIAAATYTAFQTLEDNVKGVYRERLDKRHPLTKLDAAAGKWLSGGSSKVGSWLRKASVSSGLSFATGAVTGLIGAGTAAGFPITAAFAGTFATVKAGIRREALIELNGESDRKVGVSLDDHKNLIDDYMRGVVSGSLDEHAVRHALERLADKSIDDSKNRQKALRVQVGAIAVGTVAGGLAGYLGITDKLGDGVSAVIDKAHLDEFVGNVAEGFQVAATDTTSMVLSAAGSIDDKMPGSLPGFGSQDPEGSNTPKLPEHGTVSNNSTSVTTGNSAVETQPPMAGAQGGEAVGAHSGGAGADGGGAGIEHNNTGTGSNNPDYSNPGTVEPGDADEGFIGPELIEDVDPGVSIEDLTAEVTVGEGDGVTQVLRTVLAENGYTDVSPDELFKMYQGLTDPQIGVGADNVFNGIELEFNPDTHEWWIMGDGNVEASLTPEAAAWIHENSLPSLEADSSTIEPVAAAVENPLATSDPESYAPVEPIEIVANPDLLTDMTTVSDGEGVTHILSRAVDNAGYGEITSGQSLTAYNGLIDQVGPNGVFETVGSNGDLVSVQLELSPAGNEYWIPEDVTEVQLTPEASAWVEHNITNIQNGVEIEPDATGPENPDVYRGETADAADTEASDVIQPNEVIGDGTGDTSYNGFELLTNTVPVENGDGVTHLLGKSIESVGYGEATPGQLLTTYNGLVETVGPDGIFETVGPDGNLVSVQLEPGATAGEYWVPSGVTEVHLTPDAAAWVQENTIPNLEADSPTIESISDTTDPNAIQSDATGGANYSAEATDPDVGTIEAIDEADSLEAIEPAGAITINQGDGVTQVLENVLTTTGHENVTPSQLFEVYQGLVQNPEIGPDGVFEGVTLEWDEATQQFWIPGGNFTDGTLTTDLTPEAAAWIESNLPEIQAGEPPMIEPVDGSQIIEQADEPQDIEPIHEGVIAPDNVHNIADYRQGDDYNQRAA